MARVAAHTSIPMASGERLVTKYEFSQLIEKGAASIIQIDVGQAGGILGAEEVRCYRGSPLRDDRSIYVLRAYRSGGSDLG